MDNRKEPYGQIILPDGNSYSLDGRQTGLNSNMLIVATSGAGKTRDVITPAILECNGSYVISDMKGMLFKTWGKFMRDNGYRTVRVSFSDPSHSYHYNPLHYVNTTQEIQILAHSLVEARGIFRSDPYWDQMSELLISSIISYLKETSSEKESTIANVLAFLRLANRKDEESGDKRSRLSKLFYDLQQTNPRSWAVKQFAEVNLCAGKTWASIASTAVSKLAAYDTEELGEMMKYDVLDFQSIGQKRTCVFVETSDTDRSMDAMINVFFSQAMHQLCQYADTKCKDNELPVPVTFIIDDFGSGCRIDNFEKMISNIRSRRISAILAIQSFAQLREGYGESASTIADDCDTLLYLGSNDPQTAQQIAVRVNKTPYSVLHMPLHTSWIIRRGAEPVFVEKNMALDDYLKERDIEPDTSYDLDDPETDAI